MTTKTDRTKATVARAKAHAENARRAAYNARTSEDEAEARRWLGVASLAWQKAAWACGRLPRNHTNAALAVRAAALRAEDATRGVLAVLAERGWLTEEEQARRLRHEEQETQRRSPALWGCLVTTKDGQRGLVVGGAKDGSVTVERSNGSAFVVDEAELRLSRLTVLACLRAS